MAVLGTEQGGLRTWTGDLGTKPGLSGAGTDKLGTQTGEGLRIGIGGLETKSGGGSENYARRFGN